ncbi:MAG: hypothetical protein GY795_39225 [Desulfobacterales bacterium]|nr:hypothetical protein [Desulfobacterales bacterium]
MNINRFMINWSVKLFFLLSLIITISNGIVIADEYTINIKSLEVLKADEYSKTEKWNSQTKSFDKPCKSKFILNIDTDIKLPEVIRDCDEKEFIPKTFMINKEIKTENPSLFIKIIEDDWGTDDILAPTSICIRQDDDYCKIDLTLYKGDLSIKFKGQEDYKGWNYPIEVKLNLSVKRESVELDYNFIAQMQKLIQKEQQKIFIEDFICPHTEFDILYKKFIYSSRQKSSIKFDKTSDNKIRPPYFKWNDKDNIQFRFSNGELIPDGKNIKKIYGKEGIAFPVLKWMLYNKGKGQLVFSRDGKPYRIFNLYDFVFNYKKTDDYELGSKDFEDILEASIALPKEITNVDTLKRLISEKKGILAFSFSIDNIEYNKTISSLEIKSSANKCVVTFPAGNYLSAMNDTELKREGIFSIFDSSMLNKNQLSWKLNLRKKIRKKIEYPDEYPTNLKNECNPLKSISTSDLIKDIIDSASNGINIDCPYLTTKNIRPEIKSGEITLDLKKMEMLQTELQLSSGKAAGWLLVDNQGKNIQLLPETGRIEIINLPSSDFTLEPPANLIRFDSQKIDIETIISKGIEKMKKDKISISKELKKISDLRWRYNPLIISLGKLKARKAESHVNPNSIWSKISYSLKRKGQAPEKCDIRDGRIECEKEKNLYLKDLVDAKITPIGLTSRGGFSIEEKHFQDIYCGCWDKLFNKRDGLDIYVPGADWSSTKSFKIGFDKGGFKDIDQSEIPTVWSFVYNEDQVKSQKTVTGSKDHRLKFKDMSVILLEGQKGSIKKAHVGCENKKPQCEIISKPKPKPKKPKPRKPEPRKPRKPEPEVDINVDIIIVGSRGYNNSRTGWMKFLAQQQGEMANKIYLFSKNCKKSMLLSVYLLFIDESENVNLERIFKLNSFELKDKTVIFNALIKNINEITVWKNLMPRRIKNQIPWVIHHLLSHRGHEQDGRIGIFVHDDRTEDEPILNISRLNSDLKLKNHSVVVLRKKSGKSDIENRISYKSIEIDTKMDMDGKWTEGFFNKIMKCD